MRSYHNSEHPSQIQNRNRMKHLISVILLLSVSLTKSASPVEVEVKQGKVLGSLGKSRGGREFYIFKGIPYGKVERRFDPSVPADGWTGVRDANQYGPACGQFGILFARATEPAGEEANCLFINVWTPSLKDKQKLVPVVVNIHGGGFQTGSGDMLPGDYFMDEDVVFVSLNYRLGILGFLSLGEEEAPGNMGLKDQSLALKWVQDNIHAFGGDKKQVMILGTSAGSASVSYHTLSPMSAGLFHSAFATSGSALNPWARSLNPKKEAQKLSEKVGCPVEPSAALLKCLREIDWQELLKAGSELVRWYVDPISAIGPVVEPATTKNPFLTEEPSKLMESGRFNKVPIVYGVMENEGILLHSAAIMATPTLKKELDEDWLQIAPITFYYDDILSERQDKLNKTSYSIRNFYFGVNPVDENSFQNLTNLYSDRLFNHGVRQASILQSKHTPVYTFIQTYQGKMGLVQMLLGNIYKESLGVSHGDDYLYLFPFGLDPTTAAPSMDPKDLQFSKQFVKLVSSVAATGKPEIADPIWTPITQEQVAANAINWYDLNLEPKMIPDPFLERMNFWEKLERKFTKYLKGKHHHKAENKEEL